MAYDVLGILKRLQIFEPHVVGEFSELFGAAKENHRQNIRKSIRERLSPHSETLMDLTSRPQLAEWSISISHCDSLGGWIAVPSPLGIGLDIELKSRIHSKLVTRIAQDGELNGVPDPALLWSAKESYFKALGDQQPTAITQLRIDNWITDRDGWRFSGLNLDGTSFTAVDLVISMGLVKNVSKREK